ncbi:MAG TPA: hypothetical protein VKB34_19635, partial [Povalibacter sp.]|nr:hypothetical protein [Povalibacter sp.]
MNCASPVETAGSAQQMVRSWPFRDCLRPGTAEQRRAAIPGDRSVSLDFLPMTYLVDTLSLPAGPRRASSRSPGVATLTMHELTEITQHLLRFSP